MRLVYFAHSLASCWNNGNAHFLRGVLRELKELGHDVVMFQPRDGWSMVNLLADHSPRALTAFAAAYPELKPISYGPSLDLQASVTDADVVIVHEWNEPWLVSGLGRLKARGGRFTLLFHDTHHRAVRDRKSTRLNSSHVKISYAVFCLKKKTPEAERRGTSSTTGDGGVGGARAGSAEVCRTRSPYPRSRRGAARSSPCSAGPPTASRPR